MLNVSPNAYSQRIWQLPIETIEKKYKLVCIDLDNTLDIPQKKTVLVIAEVEEFINRIRQNDVEILVISNNSIPGRCESFCNLLNLEYISAAKKPFLMNIKKNPTINRYSKDEILFIGDKMVTDMLCAKWFGSDAMLVDQLQNKNNHWYSKFMNISEIIFCLLNGFKKGEYFVKKM